MDLSGALKYVKILELSQFFANTLYIIIQFLLYIIVLTDSQIRQGWTCFKHRLPQNAKSKGGHQDASC